ncbi:MAG: MerR family transcriptional regulator [Blastopirellula sp.]|nr:MAG: MerR family transcriptional regulator [Blastopirellula sp.]
MFSIGEFSKITGLSVKTLRFYHEQNILVPTHIDEQSGYRYYNESKVETARVITQLRNLDFSLNDIAEILAQHEDDSDILDYLATQKESIQQKLKAYREISASLNQIITQETEARIAMNHSTFEVEEKQLETMLIAGVRMRGKYSECGKGFSQIGKKFGRHICGKPMLLHYDTQYKENDADFEACMPVRKGTSTDIISVRELLGGKCVALIHKGPYEDLGRSYEKIIAYVNEKEYEIEVPSREVYIKGPGMIFRGNPKNYLTEIQFMVKE